MAPLALPSLKTNAAKVVRASVVRASSRAVSRRYAHMSTAHVVLYSAKHGVVMSAVVAFSCFFFFAIFAWEGGDR